MAPDSRAGAVTLSWPGKEAAAPLPEVRLAAVARFAGHGGAAGRLVAADNLAALAALLAEGLEGRFTLLYADPPYGTDQSFPLRTGGRPSKLAYVDAWETGLPGYLSAIYPRLKLFHRLLSPEGTLYVHLDRRTCHYVQVLLDEVFGRKCFQNVIVWRREVSRGRKAQARHFGNNVEYLLCYTKNPRGAVWNPIVAERSLSREEAERLYRRDERGFYSTSHRGTYSDARLAALAREGRLHVTRGGSLVEEDGRVAATRGTIRIKYYLEPRGDRFVKLSNVDNLWDDIRGIAESGPERCGYPTQKPERLLERIILASSRPGDLVGDFYAGSGTTGVVAGRLGRAWVMADNSPAAIETCRKRLLKAGHPFTVETAQPWAPAKGD
ncbi:MAG: DNA methyltransferase [Chitinophagales bacterium]